MDENIRAYNDFRQHRQEVQKYEKSLGASEGGSTLDMFEPSKI